jgi:hypothetical protein
MRIAMAAITEPGERKGENKYLMLYFPKIGIGIAHQHPKMSHRMYRAEWRSGEVVWRWEE